MNTKIVYGLLDNGLNVIIAPRQETSAIAIWIFTHGGSDYENEDDNGIHHFLEHMYFKGTEKRLAQRDIWRSIEGRGGEINAQTDKEVVGYGTVMNYTDLELNIELLADILLNSRFDSKDVDLEKGVILGEKRGCDCVSQIEVLWDTLLYPDCAWSFSIMGPEKNIKSMTRENLIACMREHYLSNSTILSIAGRVDPNMAMELVNKYFSKVRKGKSVVKPRGRAVNQGSPQLFWESQETEQTHLMIGVRGYGLHHPLKNAFELLGVILGGNSSSRLFTLVRGERGLAYDIYTQTSVYTDRGELFTYAGIDHANLLETVEVILGEYRKTARGKITKQELEEAKEYTLGSLGRSFENSSNLAAFLGLRKLFSEPNLTPQREIEVIKRVTLEEINTVALDIFRNEKLNLAILGPRKGRRHLERIFKF